MKRNSFFYKITVLLLLVLSSFMLYFCRDFDNPVDSDSDNYQGYPSVGTVNEVEPYLPANGSILSWCSFTCLPCPYADYYHIQVSNSNSNFEGNIVTEKLDCNYNEITLSVSESIASVNTLYWRVRAHDSSSGQWGDWSSIWSFTAQGIISSGLDPPNDGATGDTTPLLNWSDFSGASSYQIQFSDSEGGVLIATPINVSSSQYQINSGLEEGKKYWRIRPVKSNSVAGFWSSTWNFTVNLGIPSNPDPENGGTIDNTTPLLGWEDVTGAIGYHIQVNTMSDFTGTVIADATPSSSEYQVTTVLDNNTIYYWRVRIKDTNGVFGYWSSAWSFNIKLDVPINPNPANGANIIYTKPLLNWDDVLNATGYHIQLNTQSDFNGTMVADDSSLTSSQYQCGTTLSFDTTYYWHVKQKNIDGVWGDWSNTWNFIIRNYWSKTYGGSGGDSANFVQITSDGGFIIACDTTSFGVEGDDWWILKLDSEGTIIWQKTYGGTENDLIYSIQETSDDGFIATGRTMSFGVDLMDAWVIKINSEGSIIWQKAFGGTSIDYFTSIQEISGGGFIASGRTSYLGPNGDDALILKLNSSGSIIWQKAYSSGEGSDYINSIQETSDGGFIAAGFCGAASGGLWVLKLNSDGTISWSKTYSNDQARYIQQISGGGYIVAGEIDSLGDGNTHFWVLKLNSDGSIVWQKAYRYSVNSDELVNSIQEVSEGGFIVVGRTDVGSNYYGWILRLNDSGSILWQKIYGDHSSITSIQETSDNDFIVAGHFNDAWLLKLNSNGNCPPLDSDTSISPIDTFVDINDTISITDSNTDATVTNTNATVINTNAVINQQAP